MAINETPKRTEPLVENQQSDIERKDYANDPTKTNRAHQIKRSNDTVKNISVTLQDIDENILYYFNEVIRPTAIENNVEIDVPVRYGSPESWNIVQRDGFMRDNKGKVIVPVVMARRTSISKDESIPIDKAERNMVRQYPIKWSAKNSYDRFSLLTHNPRKKTYEVFNIVVPDYVTISYECIIWTSYVTQMNKIVEQIYYNEGTNWGDPKKFKFSTMIDSFDQNIDISTDRGRVVRSNFSLNVRGYLIPEAANNQITTQKSYTKQQIILGEETEVRLEDIK